MKVLFFMILTIITTIGYLIAPGAFQFSGSASSTVIEKPTAAPTDVITRNWENTAEPNVVEPVTEPTPASAVDLMPVQTNASPESIFGGAKVEDNFERGSSGFGISAGLNDDENIRIIALNNRLSLEPKKNNGWLTWRLRPPVIKDSAAQMEFSIFTCARGDRTGLMMRAADYSSGHGYYFSISCEGTVSILRDSYVLNTADARGAFNNNSGDINIMTAMTQGNTLTIMLNGESLLTVQDDAYTEGYSGFFTAPQGQNTLTMDILSFKEYYNE